jgi:hypothetical protein
MQAFFLSGVTARVGVDTSLCRSELAREDVEPDTPRQLLAKKLSPTENASAAQSHHPLRSITRVTRRSRTSTTFIVQP